jgi:hypothetical protein
MRRRCHRRQSACAEVVARHEVAGVQAEIRRPVTRLIQPAAWLSTDMAVVPPLRPSPDSFTRRHATERSIENRQPQARCSTRRGKSDGVLTLKVPAGGQSRQRRGLSSCSRARFLPVRRKAAVVDERARASKPSPPGGREYREGYATLRHRDPETVTSSDAVTTVCGRRSYRAWAARRLRHGHRDEVPSGIAGWGRVDVGRAGLATGDLSSSTRCHGHAHAVRRP